MKKSIRKFENILAGLVIIFSIVMLVPTNYVISSAENEVITLDDSRCTVITEEREYIYSGIPIEQEMEVLYDETHLVEDVDYKVTYSDNVNVGTALLVIEGIGKYTGTLTREFAIHPASLDSVVVDESMLKDYEFEGKDKTPIVELTYNGKRLNIIADYEVIYENNFYPGTATITITGVGNFTGEIVRTFNIVKKRIGNVTIRTDFNANNQLDVYVNNGSEAMVKGRDYIYTTVTDTTGKLTITFTGIGDNYIGTFVKVIAAKDNPNAPKETTTTKQETTKVSVPKAKINKATKKKVSKKIKISLKKMKGASKYQIQISKSKKFNKKHILVKKTVKKSILVISSKKIKNRKTLYVRARAIKIINGKTYFGDWSKVKKAKISK